MDTLILEDFRCFAGRNEVPIRPLTLLVGENSTGKTSFLAAARAAHELGSGATPDFNEEPFRLGSYDQIANYRGGRAGRAKSFVVGQQFVTGRGRPRVERGGARRVMMPRSNVEVQIEARLTSIGAQPAISEIRISSGNHELLAQVPQNAGPVVSFYLNDQLIHEQRTPEELWPATRFEQGFWLVLDYAVHVAVREDVTSINDEEREQLEQFIRSARDQSRSRLYAFAPIRTSPQRTYDPVKEVRDPEGSHIPLMLARLLGDGDGSEFKERLDQFGAASGLYSSLSVHKLGQRGSDPFQVQVKHPRGPSRNLIDVGYGVSQAIPIIADCVSAERGSTLLIQQPEVHLHPRAQAAMGSFFGQLAASGRNRLVVETHSDYLLDRVRMDVRDEKIGAGDVMILYFEQGRQGVDIHPINVDAAGRVVGVPEGYRSFFLEEDRRFFGVGQ